AAHDQIFAEESARHDGSLIKSRGEGDSVFVVFPKPTDALEAVVAAQRRLQQTEWPEGVQLRVRSAIHSGEAEMRDGDYFGSPINRTARLRAIAHGCQTIISEATFELVRDCLPELVTVRDLGRHRLKDLSRPERIFQVLHPEIKEDFPALRSLDTRPHNLPVELTSFIGREREMLQIRELLSGTRLLTLTGAGGAGKTRLAYQTAADVLEDHPDGVWIVELAPVFEPELVPQAVASIFGIRQESAAADVKPEPGKSDWDRAGEERRDQDEPVVEKLISHLKEKNLLIVLDNCEHLIASAATLADRLLRGCPHVKLLATSREPLGVPGETPWRVPSLSMPDLKNINLDDLDQYEAVRLFIERATQAMPEFNVTNENAPAVAQICHRLDGIPLAIELAAARVKVLSPEQIQARLDDQFRLLTGGSRTALPRQQTLRALVDWSYQLLSDPEKILLRRLGVFVGGLTLDAAEAICADAPSEEGGLESFEILDVLSHVVDKSLVLMDPLGTSPRYRLNETIRQYAREKLLESPEVATLRRRQRDWFLELAEQAKEELEGDRYEQWIDRLEEDHDNLRQALQWSMTPEEADCALRLGAALQGFWRTKGYLTEGKDWLAQALALEGDPPKPAKAMALLAAASMDLTLALHRSGTPLVEEALDLFREIEDERGIADALLVRAGFAQVSDYSSAPAFSLEAAEIYERIGVPSKAAVAMLTTARAFILLGKSDETIATVERALKTAEESGNKRTIMLALRSLASTLGAGGASSMQGSVDIPRAEALLQRSLSIAKEMNDRRAIAESLRRFGWLEWSKNNIEALKKYSEDSLAIYKELGDARELWRGNYFMGQAFHDNYDEARPYYERSLLLARELGDRWAEMFSLNNLGLVAPSPAEAKSFYQQALEIGLEVDDPDANAMWYMNLSFNASSRNDPEAAFDYAAKSLEQRQRLGDRLGAGEAYIRMANLKLKSGKGDEAERLLQEGLELVDPEPIRRMYSLNAFAWGAWELGMPEAGLPHAEEAVRISRELPDQTELDGVGHTLGEILQELGRDDEAQELFDAAISGGKSTGGPYAKAEFNLSRGWIALKRGKADEAGSYFLAAIDFSKETKNMGIMATILECFSGVLLANGNPGAAATLIGAARIVRGEFSRAPVIENRLDKVRLEAEQLLGKKAYEEAEHAGLQMKVSEAIDFARTQVTPIEAGAE
ncbi:MAG TPA: AAA family ATPase, partial [Actinomycetota bacterium]|nr:AAA family ATPase [Actinomycetota bacterium]